MEPCRRRRRPQRRHPQLGRQGLRASVVVSSHSFPSHPGGGGTLNRDHASPRIPTRVGPGALRRHSVRRLPWTAHICCRSVALSHRRHARRDDRCVCCAAPRPRVDCRSRRARRTRTLAARPRADWPCTATRVVAARERQRAAHRRMCRHATRDRRRRGDAALPLTATARPQLAARS